MSHHCVAGMRSWVTGAHVALIEVDQRPRAVIFDSVDVAHDLRSGSQTVARHQYDVRQQVCFREPLAIHATSCR
jgi:hypothetical protein